MLSLPQKQPLLPQTNSSPPPVPPKSGDTTLVTTIETNTRSLKTQIADLKQSADTTPNVPSTRPQILPQSAPSPVITASEHTLTRQSSSSSLSEAALAGLSREEKRELVALRTAARKLVPAVMHAIEDEIRDVASKKHMIKMSDLNAILADHMPAITTAVTAQFEKAHPDHRSPFTPEQRDAVIAHLVGLEVVRLIPHMNDSGLKKGLEFGSKILDLVADGLSFVPGVNFLSLPVNILSSLIGIGVDMMDSSSQLRLVDENGKTQSRSKWLSIGLTAARIGAEFIPGVSTPVGVANAVIDGIGLVKAGAAVVNHLAHPPKSAITNFFHNRPPIAATA